MSDPGFGLAFPWWLALGSIVLGMAVSIWSYRSTTPRPERHRRTLLIALRTVALSALVLTLFDAFIAGSGTAVKHPTLLIALDRSASMARLDSGRSRFDRAGALTRALLDALPPERRRLVLFADSVEPADEAMLARARPDGKRTDLAGLLAADASSGPGGRPGGVLLISDGLISGRALLDGVDADQPLPVFTLPPGHSPARPDLRLLEIATPRLGFAQLEQPVTVRFSGVLPEAASVTVTLSDGIGTTRSRQVPLRAGAGDYHAAFLYRPSRPGQVRLTATVTTLPAETSSANNRATTLVEVREDRRSALLLAGAPGPDVAFIRRALERMADVDLSVAIGIGPRMPQIAEEELEAADILLLVNFPGETVPPAVIDRIARAVDRRRIPILVIPGATTSMPLLQRLGVPFLGDVDWMQTTSREVRPVAGAPSHAMIGGLGEAIDRTDWQRLPPVSVPIAAPEVHPEAQVLLQSGSGADARPFLALRDRPERRTAMFGGYGLWRWELSGEGLSAVRGEEPFPLLRSLISSSVRWLETGSTDGPVAIYAVRPSWRLGERVLLRGESLQPREPSGDRRRFRVTVRSGERRTQVDMQPVGGAIWEGALENLGPGTWHYSGSLVVGAETIGTDAGSFVVDSLPIEETSSGTDRGFLRSLAERSGGISFDPVDPDDISTVVDSILNHPGMVARTIESRSETSFRHSPWLLLLTLALVSTEWYLRRRSGLA